MDAQGPLSSNFSYPKRAQYYKCRLASKLPSFQVDYTGVNVIVLKYFRRKYWRFRLTLLLFRDKNDHKLEFQEKRHFFRRKFVKIGKNSDHNIRPCSPTKKNILNSFWGLSFQVHGHW
jgi:hypothetical protein